MVQRVLVQMALHSPRLVTLFRLAQACGRASAEPRDGRLPALQASAPACMSAYVHARSAPCASPYPWPRATLPARLPMRPCAPPGGGGKMQTVLMRQQRACVCHRLITPQHGGSMAHLALRAAHTLLVQQRHHRPEGGMKPCTVPAAAHPAARFALQPWSHPFKRRPYAFRHMHAAIRTGASAYEGRSSLV